MVIVMRAAALVIVLAGCGGQRAVTREHERDASVALAADQAPSELAPPDARRGLTPAQLEALDAVAVAGWQIDARDRTDTSLVVTMRQGTLRAVVTAGRCLRCREMDAAAWQDELPALRASLPGAIEDDPETKFELATVDVGGRPCIATWELGAMTYGDDLLASHGARIYCQQDDVELAVRVDDEAVAHARSAKSARKAAVRATVEDAAKALAAAYATVL